MRGAPNLVVEIGSTSHTPKRDETIKRRLYERCGVDEYWVVDPALERIAVYRPGAAGYERAADLWRERDEQLTSPLFPGLTLPLSDIFSTD